MNYFGVISAIVAYLFLSILAIGTHGMAMDPTSIAYTAEEMYWTGVVSAVSFLASIGCCFVAWACFASIMDARRDVRKECF